MKIDVYDSYVKSSQGHVMHFDVLVETQTPPELAWKYGQKWLKTIGEKADSLEQSRCNYCHTESANREVQRIVEEEGYFILQMEGCPVPIK